MSYESRSVVTAYTQGSGVDKTDTVQVLSRTFLMKNGQWKYHLLLHLYVTVIRLPDVRTVAKKIVHILLVIILEAAKPPEWNRIRTTIISVHHPCGWACCNASVSCLQSYIFTHCNAIPCKNHRPYNIFCNFVLLSIAIIVIVSLNAYVTMFLIFNKIFVYIDLR